MEEVKVYGTKLCSNCKMAMALFESSGVFHPTKINIDDDQELLDKFASMGFMSMPVIEYDGKFFSGSPVTKVQQFINEYKESNKE
jgi:glutaredoxin